MSKVTVYEFSFNDRLPGDEVFMKTISRTEEEIMEIEKEFGVCVAMTATDETVEIYSMSKCSLDEETALSIFKAHYKLLVGTKYTREEFESLFHKEGDLK